MMPFKKYLLGILITTSLIAYGDDELNHCGEDCLASPPTVYESYSGGDINVKEYLAKIHQPSQADVYQAIHAADLDAFNKAMQAGSQVITGDLYGRPFNDTIPLYRIFMSWQLEGESGGREIDIADYTTYMLATNYDQPDAWAIFEQMFRAADDDGRRHYTAFEYIPSLLVTRTKLTSQPDAQAFVARVDNYLSELFANDSMFLPLIIELGGYSARYILDQYFLPYGVSENDLERLGLTVGFLEDKLKQVQDPE